MPEQYLASLLCGSFLKSMNISTLGHYINMIIELGVKSLRLSRRETSLSLSLSLSLSKAL